MQGLTGDVEERRVGESGAGEERVDGGAGEALAVVAARGNHPYARSAHVDPMICL